MNLLIDLLAAENELSTARERVKGLKKRRDGIYAQMLALAVQKHWECPECGSTEHPVSGACVNCGDRKIKQVPMEVA